MKRRKLKALIAKAKEAWFLNEDDNGFYMVLERKGGEDAYDVVTMPEDAKWN